MDRSASPIFPNSEPRIHLRRDCHPPKFLRIPIASFSRQLSLQHERCLLDIKLYHAQDLTSAHPSNSRTIAPVFTISQDRLDTTGILLLFLLFSTKGYSIIWRPDEISISQPSFQLSGLGESHQIPSSCSRYRLSKAHSRISICLHATISAKESKSSELNERRG